MNNSIIVSLANSLEYKFISEFYSRFEEDIHVAENETVFVAHVEKEIVGVVRLVNESTYFVLRTLIVSPDFQKQGIGSALTRTLIAHVPTDMPIYCLPYPHVRIFYGHFGFKEISPEALPDVLKQRYYEYKKEFPVTAMMLAHQQK